MKTVILTIFVLSSTQLISQEWHLERINQESEYPYEYWFSYQHLLDTNSYEIEKQGIKSQSLVQGTILNNESHTLPFALVRITNLSVDTSTVIQSDIDGEFSMILKPGRYRIEALYHFHDKFNTEIELEEKQAQTITLKLGKGPEDEVYQINSKKELSEESIEQIIDCVEKSRPDYNKSCAKRNEYFIMMHI